MFFRTVPFVALLAACDASPADAPGAPPSSSNESPPSPDEPQPSPGAPRMVVFGDTNRDGRLDEADVDGRDQWSWKGSGALVLANVDDDDGDGKPDGDDEQVDGDDDARDLAPLTVEVSPALIVDGASLRLSIDPPAAAARLRIFRRADSGWEHVTADLRSVSPRTTFAVEAKELATGAWDGAATLEVRLLRADGSVVASDRMKLHVAPWLALPSSAKTTDLYVATGHSNYENAAFRSDLQAAATKAGAKLHVFQTTRWKEMWMQDTMELGYAEVPGAPRMFVAIEGIRGDDAFPRTLLGRDVGVVRIGAHRGIANGIDDWADWFGNLEVSPPVKDFPLGRVYYGIDASTGVGMHPDVVAFLNAQVVQAPFSIDTSWLVIKHVDEMISFVPGADGRPRMLVVSPRAANAIVAKNDAYRMQLQARIDKTVADLVARLGLEPEQVVELPVHFTAGASDWSNPVNGLFLNGQYLAGATDVPPAIKNAIASKLTPLGIEVVFVDDTRYQRNLGNVHCATNTRRVPLAESWRLY